MNYVESIYDGYEVYYHSSESRFAWPCLTTFNDLVVMELCEGSGDEWYEEPQISRLREDLLPDTKENVYNYLKSFCR